MRGKRGHWFLWLMFAVIGTFIGNRLGDALQATLPVAANYSSLGFDSRELSVLDLGITLGLSLRVNLMGAVGAVGGLLLARRI